MHGGAFSRAADWETFRAAVRRAVAAPGLHVVEAVCPDRTENVHLHDAVWQNVAEACAAALGPEGAGA